MPNRSCDFARRICSQLGFAILILGFASSAANAGISSGLRDLLQGAMGVDLRVDSLSLNKSQATIGETLRATVGVSNGGKAAAVSAVLTLWARFGSSTSTSNAFRLATVRLGTLQPQTRITSVNTFPVPNFGRPGAYQVFATVESSASEANRQNNTQAKTLMVIGPALSDTDSQPASDPDDSSVPPPPSPPLVGGGSSPLPGSGGSSTPSVPASGAGSGSGSSAPPPESSGSGSSSPPAPVPTPPTFTCDYYGSPSGRGSGTTPESPFKIRDFWALASPGKTLCLLDGLYTGSDSMIDPPDGLKGAPGKPINVRALNDGSVLIDGQFERPTILFQFGNNYWTVQGINARNSSSSVISVHRAGHLVFKRMVVWDSPIDVNRTTVGIHHTNDPLAGGGGVLLEDVAAFGTGRKTFSNSQRGDNVTCRRCFGRWEGSTRQGPKMTFSTVYGSYGFVCENCIAMWSGESMPQTYNLTTNDGSNPLRTDFQVDQPYGLLAMDGSQLADNCKNVALRGSLALVRASDVVPTNLVGGGVLVFGNISCYTIRHTMAFIQPGGNTHVRGFRLDNGTGTSQSAENVTSVRASGATDTFGTSWSSSQRSIGTALGSIASPWTTTGAGANLCKRWVNGVVTTEPLWPWPMNDRIKAATAMAGAYAGPCLGCRGGRLARKSTDVTAIVESVLGPIPSTCKR